MKIEHIAIWTNNLEELKSFYCTYFNGTSNEKYTNPQKQFESYFISFKEGTRLELMRKTPLNTIELVPFSNGITHFAFSVGTKETVDSLTNRLRNDGYTIYGEPRMTGDGYYESVILDPDGNHVELVAS